MPMVIPGELRYNPSNISIAYFEVPHMSKQTKSSFHLIVLSSILTLLLLFLLFLGSNRSDKQITVDDAQIMDAYDAFMANQIQNAYDSALTVDKVFWIGKDDTAPIPNQDCYGETEDPSTLQWLLEEAAAILDGQNTLFNTDIQIYPGSKVTYYLDDTILAITWKQVFDDFVYTISEVKIAHPSQLRRYLAGNEYDSNELYTTTTMAQTVNAVVASSGDLYKGRKYGIIVYDGEVKRVDGSQSVDTCMIDQNGNLVFVYRGEITDMETAQQFVDEHRISFSIAFGPVLVDKSERCEPANYALGEINDGYPRAALGQRDELHYVVTVANGQGSHWEYPTIHEFASRVATFGCEKVYSLDGGQTGVIAMNGKLMNPVQFGKQRQISDIFYFATAIPSN